MVTGTIKSAVNLQVMDSKWQQRKNNINAKKNVKEMTCDERMHANFQERMDAERESNKHANIYNKLKTGGKLTSDEIDYLKKNDPESLKKYREAQAEKEAYENALKNCKTKDEVERVKMNKLGEFSTQAKQITTDPYIPLDKKVELMNQLNNKLCLVEDAHMDFVKSQAYLDMPSDNERTRKHQEEENVFDEKTDEQTDTSSEGAVTDSPEYDIEKLKEKMRHFSVSFGNDSNWVNIGV